MKLTKEEKLRIKIRKEMIKEGFFIYDCYGHVDEKLSQAFADEFKKRYNDRK